MNTFTFFALLVCAIVAMVDAVPSPSQPQPALEAHEAIPEGLEAAESHGYGYGHGGYGGHGHDHGHHGHDHHGHDHHGHDHHGHGYSYGR